MLDNRNNVVFLSFVVKHNIAENPIFATYFENKCSL